jgi:hypothetical protein
MTPGSKIIKKYSKLKSRSPVFDWLEISSECTLTNENPEMNSEQKFYNLETRRQEIYRRTNISKSY